MLLKARIVPTVGRSRGTGSRRKNINELLEYLDLMCFFLDNVEEEFGRCKVKAEVPPYPRGPALIIPHFLTGERQSML